MVSITVVAASKASPFARSLPLTLQLDGDAKISDVKAAISNVIPEFYVSRQKLSLKGDKKALNDESRLVDVGVEEGSELNVKDLGPQVKWHVVFLFEYLGPLVLHPLIWNLPEVIYGQSIERSSLQKLVYAMVLIHFVKRELETVFVHRFSHATMPLYNLFKNSLHYHIFCGILMAYDIYSPTYSATSPYIKGTIRENPRFLMSCAALWAFCELSNFSTHVTLRNLRPANSKKRAIPFGYGFHLLSCPNYFFELLGWIVICAMTGSWGAWFFTVAATGQMLIWAVKKHKAYKKEFGDKYPRGRKAMIPFVI